jgi:hypothetical protein
MTTSRRVLSTLAFVVLVPNALAQSSPDTPTPFATCKSWGIDITDKRTGKGAGMVFSMKDDYQSIMKAAASTEKQNKFLCHGLGPQDQTCFLVLEKPRCLDHRKQAKSNNEFKIRIDRQCVTSDGTVKSNFYVNGDSFGVVSENIKTLIAPGNYPGFARIHSGKNFVQGSFGTMGQSGDFLLEIGNARCVTGRPMTDVLMHGGTRAEHSRGCVLLGPVAKGEDGVAYIQNADASLLSRLRTAFYGSALPNSSPNLDIQFELAQPEKIPSCQ